MENEVERTLEIMENLGNLKPLSNLLKAASAVVRTMDASEMGPTHDQFEALSDAVEDVCHAALGLGKYAISQVNEVVLEHDEDLVHAPIDDVTEATELEAGADTASGGLK
jgi:hypothetical protein